MSLRVVARLSARPETASQAKALLAELVTPTRAEAGCISYLLLQNNEDPTDFTFVEEWESEAALQAHLGAPHMVASFEKVPALLGGPPDIRRYSVVA